MSQEDTAPESGEKKSKAFMIVVGVLVVLILLAGGYFLITRMGGDTNVVEKLGYVSQEDYDSLNSQLTTCNGELVAVEECDETEDGLMMKKEVELGKYNVMFEYPEEYYEFIDLQSSDTDANTFIFQMYYDYVVDEMEYGNPIFRVTSSSMEAYPETSEDYEEIEIDGETYMIRFLPNGDGGMGGASYENSYEVKLEDDLYVSVVASMSRKSEDNEGICSYTVDSDLPSCADTELDIIFEYETTEAELEQAFEVMKSFTYETL